MQPGDELPPAEQDWHRFQQLSQLDNHWERPGWTDDRRSYHWLLTFEHASGLRELAAQCQELFHSSPRFDLVPLDTLHLTLQRVTFTDELSAADLETAVASVSQTCRYLAPFRLRIGWPAGSTGAVRLTALPTAPVVELRNVVRRSVPTRSVDRFWPHVSIAYSNTAQPVAPIVTTIEPLRSLSPAEALISSLVLVELRRESQVYRWEVLERVELGGPMSAQEQ
ncbi:MAG: 2'-5' RNA ligase family protein [Pseudonocardia sp.]